MGLPPRGVALRWPITSAPFAEADVVGTEKIGAAPSAQLHIGWGAGPTEQWVSVEGQVTWVDPTGLGGGGGGDQTCHQCVPAQT